MNHFVRVSGTSFFELLPYSLVSFVYKNVGPSVEGWLGYGVLSSCELLQMLVVVFAVLDIVFKCFCLERTSYRMFT